MRSDWSDCACCKLLIVQSANTVGKGIEPDETARIALLVHVIFAESDESLIVQRVFACSTDNRHRPLEQTQGHSTCDTFLSDADESVVRLALSSPPTSLINE